MTAAFPVLQYGEFFSQHPIYRKENNIMSKNYFRVLSIDFDFFPKVNKTQLSEYPDGIDLPTELSEIVWSTRNERMENI